MSKSPTSHTHASHTSPRMIFVNLPVADLRRSVAFYEAVGATRNLQFSDDTAAAMVLSDTIYVMLLTHPKFAQFTAKPIADAHASCGMLLALSLDGRAAVDAIVGKAAAAGGRTDIGPIEDLGFMYCRRFEDPDGHVWEPFWMDLEAAAAGMAKGYDAAS